MPELIRVDVEQSTKNRWLYVVKTTFPYWSNQILRDENDKIMEFSDPIDARHAGNAAIIRRMNKAWNTSTVSSSATRAKADEQFKRIQGNDSNSAK